MKLEQQWSSQDACDLYNIDRWGLGYFDVDDEGFLVVAAGMNGHKSVRLLDLVDHFQQQKGMAPPMILRFPGIIRQRMGEINEAFSTAIKSFNYEGSYSCIFPVKVNQHIEVVEAAIDAGRPFGGGVEAGSKAELLAIIAMTDNKTPLLCNGFKDQSVVEMAMRAIQMGRQMTLVIEKPNEVQLVVECVRRLGVCPRLGIRVKLSARGAGHWQSSGGSRSKFGLTIPELMHAVTELRGHGLLDAVHLLHFHPGSQITNVRKIKASIIEATRIYADLVTDGVPLKIIDVGGGLAVDYTGHRNKEPSSMNYTLQEYANDVVYYIQMICDQEGVSHPKIYSESGRALTAHHSVLIVPIVGTSQTHVAQAMMSTRDEIDMEIAPLAELVGIAEEVTEKNVLESFHDAQTAMEIALQMFSNGSLTIEQRAIAESLTWSICTKINSLLDELEFVPKDLDELRFALSDTYFANFSLFQALPDAWALGQLFPVVPIHRLNERPSRFGILADMTCDSDGKLDCFVGTSGPNRGLPLHPFLDQPYHLGIFLVGAYQESLSDDHNLMGKFHIVNVDEHEPYENSTFVYGSTLREVLEHVHHDWPDMSRDLRQSVELAVREDLVTPELGAEIFSFFELMSEGYTYLGEPVGEPVGSGSRGT